ncbi:hypothetical protein DPEC_G00359000 [Dallia pectoralis]|uniref:Uncharacterized protein n=1 Tax=Dallia pectoralis TaxID=75939 RepID=A0ACC2F0M1_DALPE|nr:hypothetical protein DPEC_G00359000 [Dallia pectoralis]
MAFSRIHSDPLSRICTKPLVLLCSLLTSLCLLHSLTPFDDADSGPVLYRPDQPQVDGDYMVPLKRFAPRFVGNTGSAAGGLSPLGEGSKKPPQALIIGVKKGGTRALLEFLRVHPDIRAVGAEPHFFDRNYENGLQWYRPVYPVITVYPLIP